QTAQLPDTDEITADAVKAEEMLADLQSNAELAGSLATPATAGMSDEEKALYEELERETGNMSKIPPVVKSDPAKTQAKKEKESTTSAVSTTPTTPQRESALEPSPVQARRSEPEAG